MVWTVKMADGVEEEEASWPVYIYFLLPAAFPPRVSGVELGLAERTKARTG